MLIRKDVIVAALSLWFIVGAQQAVGAWTYDVDRPEGPRTTKRRELHNPTVEQIEDAISRNTRVDIIGTVDASRGGTIRVRHDDVRLNFSRAKRIEWSGGDRWDGFLEISGSRVQVNGLKFRVRSSGRCRGVIIQSPASDVRLVNCEFRNVADGLIADGRWERLSIEKTRFLNCSDWSNSSMAGGYGMFLEDDDNDEDHLRLIDVKITLANNSGQHGIRIAKVSQLLIDGSTIAAAHKRSMWAYGTENMAVRNSTFKVGSVQFNLKRDEWQTDKPTRGVRLDNVRVDHDSIMDPVTIMCGKGTVDFRMRRCDINSTRSDYAVVVNWREGNGSTRSHDVTWNANSIRFNGDPVRSSQCAVSSDWSNGELNNLNIGSIGSN